MKHEATRTVAVATPAQKLREARAEL